MQHLPQSSSRRGDAERNRAKILAVARETFAHSEGTTSMAEIARRADVGMATLYRNFSGRRALLEALFTDEVNGICAAAGSVDDQHAGAALTDWLQRFYAFAANKQAIAVELLMHVDRDDAFFTDSRSRVIAAARPLLIAAQHARHVRDDLALEQLLDMIVAVAGIPGDARYRQPILRTLLDGLRRPHRKSDPG